MPTRKNFPSYKKRRQTSAMERQAEWDKLSLEQKLARATSAKEKAKYAKQLAAQTK